MRLDWVDGAGLGVVAVAEYIFGSVCLEFGWAKFVGQIFWCILGACVCVGNCG